ncbi:CYTH domain-containing protein [Oricola thermophila]|uniref:CYTH domain-containing protein n=1 Tax=Oricola thermophila TaxID=2742145 RepID=A0A6N1VEW0_9HYPH|nr:CYTH domain-containing protein [Oricola thermophila]QKV19496.1 CYTH domain-containing protein [Oricola thermophila]
MALEIERKYLVDGESWREAGGGSHHILQAYLALDGSTSVRVRISDGRRARLTVKIGRSGLVRDEFEYPVPLEDAERMIEAAQGRLIEKVRHVIPSGGFVWEVDVYEGALSGLVIAEVEMRSENDTPVLPEWIGREVTGEAAWSNAMLAIHGLPEGALP